MKTIIYLFAVLFIMLSCTSGKKSLQKGNYDEALYKAINRLRSNPTHKKSIETLRNGYPMARQWHLNKINDAESSSELFKWEKVVKGYTALNNFHNEINRCPGCLNVIPNPGKYQSELEGAKRNAASVRYDEGMKCLEKGKQGNRQESKNAYAHFEEAKRQVNNYKDVDERMKDAIYYATVRVVVEPIPMHSRSLQLSNEFFDNKINEYLLNTPVNKFVQFYTSNEAQKLGINNPDHIIQLIFDDFVVGQVYMHEKETMMLKDSIVLGTYIIEVPVNQEPGNDPEIVICHYPNGTQSKGQTIKVAESALKVHLEHGDQIGACAGQPAPPSPGQGNETRKITKKVYGQAKANVHVFTKTIDSQGILDLRIIDAYTNRVISQEKLPGAFSWQSQWGFFNGDERALDKDQLEIIKKREVPPPAPQDLFILFTQPIYQQVTNKLSSFYRNY